MVLSGRDAAICDATLALLLEVGYDRMSMDAVAARAHASKATIYRRWPGKQELVLDAVRARGVGLTVAEDTGSLRGDLVATYRSAVHGSAADDADLIAGVLRAMRTAPELADCVRSQVIESKCDVSRVIVARAIARGELPAETDPLILHEVASALWFHRVLVVGGPVDDAFIAHVVDDVLMPLLDRSSRSAELQETRVTEPLTPAGEALAEEEKNNPRRGGPQALAGPCRAGGGPAHDRPRRVDREHRAALAEGSAMFTIDASRTIISCAAASTARASQRLGSRPRRRGVRAPRRGPRRQG